MISEKPRKCRRCIYHHSHYPFADKTDLRKPWCNVYGYDIPKDAKCIHKVVPKKSKTKKKSRKGTRRK